MTPSTQTRRVAIIAAVLAVAIGLAGAARWLALRPHPPAPAAFTLDQLSSSTLDLPTFGGCGGHAVTFSDGASEPPSPAFSKTAIVMVGAASGDIYRDRFAWTALLLSCGRGGGGDTDTSFAYLAVTLGRDGEGRPQVRDVVTTVLQTRVAVRAVKVTNDVTVDLRFVFPTPFLAPQLHEQWRGFGWDGSRFEQTGGPISFADHPLAAELTVTAPMLRLTPTANRAYRGETTATVRNGGRNATGRTTIFVIAPTGLTLLDRGAASPDSPGKVSWTIRLDGLAPGTSADMVLSFDLAAGTELTVADVVLIGAEAVTADGEAMIDISRENYATVVVHRA